MAAHLFNSIIIIAIVQNRSIVTGENDQGLLSKTVLVEIGEQLPDLVVDGNDAAAQLAPLRRGRCTSRKALRDILVR